MVVHLVGIIPVSLTGIVWLANPRCIKCQHNGISVPGQWGRTYQVTQTQACSTLQSQVNKLKSRLPGADDVFIDFLAHSVAEVRCLVEGLGDTSRN